MTTLPSETQTAEAAPREGAILAYSSAAHALTHVYMLLFTPLLDPMGAAFGLGRDGITAYATISTVLFGVGAVPAGWLGDRFGEKRLLVAFFVVTALGGIVLGCSTGLAGLALGMALVGTGASIYHPVGMALLARGIRRPGRAMGWNGFWGSAGTAGGPVLAVALAALHRTTPAVDAPDAWRLPYLLLAPPMLLLGLALSRSRLGLDGPARKEPKAGDRGESALPGRGATARLREHVAALLRSPRARVVLVLLGAMTCGGLYFHLIITMLPELLEARVALPAGWEVSGPGVLAGAVYLIGGVGQVLAGRLVHHREGRGLYVLVLLGAAPLVLSLAFLQGPGLVGAAILMAVAVFMVQPIENVLLSRYGPEGARGLLFGAKFILAFGVGGLGTGLAGVVDRVFGLPAVFLVAGGFTTVAAGLACGARFLRTGRAGTEPTHPA